MLKTYLVNAISLNMFNMPAVLLASELNQEEFCKEVNDAQRQGELENAVGHEATAELINSLCGTSFKANRVQLKVEPVAKLLVISLAVRLEEGKVLTTKELQEMFEQKKVRFYKVVVV